MAPPEPPHSETFTTRFFPAAQPSAKLVVVLHGLGDSMAGFFWLPEMLALPQANYLLVNAPHPYFIGYAWYDIDDPAPGVRQGRELLLRLFGELNAQGWGSGDVLLFGFSQGCLMSIDFALRYPEPLAGIVGVSGYALLEEGTEGEIHPRAREQAWLITHGSHDPLLPIADTRAQMERLRAAGIPIEWHEYAKEHTIDMQDEIALFRTWIGERLQPPKP